MRVDQSIIEVMEDYGVVMPFNPRPAGRDCLAVHMSDEGDALTLMYEIGCAEGMQRNHSADLSGAGIEHIGSTVILYWPNIPWHPAYAGEEEDDED